MGEKYVIGVDFGTLSARGMLVSVANGRTLASTQMEYPHGVMDRTLPDGTPLGEAWALQHPQDYLDAAKAVFADLLHTQAIMPEDIIGVGCDFTQCTMMPIKQDGTPLCFLEEFRSEPHAYAKLWKHHAAQKQADHINAVARERGESFLPYYGGVISSEFMFPKILQILEEAPEVYHATDAFIELADWIVMQLTGKMARSSSIASVAALWRRGEGYPSKEYFHALHPDLENLIEEKMTGELYPIGSNAGGIVQVAAKWTGLRPGTAVSVGIGDSHSAVCGAGVSEEGILLMVLGTSGCDMLASKEEIPVDGIAGVCADSMLPGYYGYELGQPCIGDHFQWFVENCVPRQYVEDAKNKGKRLQAYMDDLAQEIAPGKSGLLALDWWNGNRSILMNSDLTGAFVGMTLSTTCQEMYKSLVEAICFGKRVIVEQLINGGVSVNKLYATGGIADKSPYVMQTFADIIGMPVHISATENGTCLGSAILAASAAGSAVGGYDTVTQAAAAMSPGVKTVYEPIPEHKAVYNLLYREYLELYHYFGKRDGLMKRLQKIRQESGN